MRIRREPFVGRAAALEVLSGRLELARQGHPQVVLVEGEAGIGKSRLVEEALGGAGGVVLWAAADEVERPLAFGVLDQLLRGRGGDARGDLPRTDSASAGGYLVDLLGELQSDGLVIVVVDDVPWADALSVQALVFALRRLRVDQVAMILTARSDELAWQPRGVEQLLSTPGGIRLRLAGLDPDVLRELARRLGAGNPSLAGARRLAEHTGGNPLHAATLLTELPAGTLEAGGDAPLPAPSSFAMLALARLARCRAATRDLVVAAAVLGLQAGVDDLARLTATPDPLPLIEEAVTGGLLVPARPPGTVAFAHPLVRAAVYHDVGLQARAELHRRAAGIAGDEWPRLRHRAAAALGPDDDLVTELAAFAGRKAEDGPAGAGVAAAAYQLAAPLASIRARREDLTLQALQSLFLAGDTAQAAGMVPALEGFEDSPRLRYVQASLGIVQGRHDEAEALLRSTWEALAGAGDGQDELQGAVAGQLAVLHLRRNELDRSAEWARRAMATGTGEAVATGSRVLPVALAGEGRLAEAMEAVSSLPADPAAVAGRDLDLLAGRGITRLWSDDLHRARDDLAQVVHGAHGAGPYGVGVIAGFYLAEAEFRLGSWDDAALHGELAASVASDADQPWALALAHASVVAPFAYRRQWEAATRHLDEALAATTGLPDGNNILWTESARAVLADARGDPETVVDAARLVEAVVPESFIPTVKWYWALAAGAYVQRGEPDRAEEVLYPAEERAWKGRYPSAQMLAARARALIEAARGDPVAAEECFRLASEVAAACPMPFERAQTELHHGAFLRRQGRRRQAAERLRHAEVAFEALGARPSLERARRELAGCGLSPSARADDDRFALTPQEQAVAHLAATGRRNREIAAELVVSVKTVEYHLGNVFRKLGVTNRAQLATRLGAFGAHPARLGTAD